MENLFFCLPPPGIHTAHPHNALFMDKFSKHINYADIADICGKKSDDHARPVSAIVYSGEVIGDELIRAIQAGENLDMEYFVFCISNASRLA